MIIELFILVAGIIFVAYKVISSLSGREITWKDTDPFEGVCARQRELLLKKFEPSDTLGWPVSGAGACIIAYRFLAEVEGWEFVDFTYKTDPEEPMLRYKRQDLKVARELPMRAVCELNMEFKKWVERFPCKDKTLVIHSRVSPFDYVLNDIGSYNDGVGERQWRDAVTKQAFAWRLRCFPNKVGARPEDYDTEEEYENACRIDDREIELFRSADEQYAKEHGIPMLCELIGWPAKKDNDKIIAVRIIAEREGWEYKPIYPEPFQFNWVALRANRIPIDDVHAFHEAWSKWVEEFPYEDKEAIIRSDVSPTTSVFIERPPTKLDRECWEDRIFEKLASQKTKS